MWCAHTIGLRKRRTGMSPVGDTVRWLVEAYERTGDIGSLLAADVPPPPSKADRALLRDLAKLHWYRYRATSGFDGLREREEAAALVLRLRERDHASLPDALRAAAPDPGVARVVGSVEYGKLERTRVLYRNYRDRDSLVMVANAYTDLMRTVTEDHLLAALTVDQAWVLLNLAAHEKRSYYTDAALAGIRWTVDKTPHDDPQRARRLLDRARILAVAGGEPWRVLADHKTSALLALRETPVWPDVIAELAQAQWDTYQRTGDQRYLIEALGTCRDLTNAVARDYPNTLSLPAFDDIAAEVTRTLGAEQTDWLLRAHRDAQTIITQFRLIDRLQDQSLVDSTPDLLDQRRDAALWLVAALPLDHPDRPDALMALYSVESDAWELAGNAEAVPVAYHIAVEAYNTLPADHPSLGKVLRGIAHSSMTLATHTGAAWAADGAVTAARRAVELAEPDTDLQASRLSLLSQVLGASYDINSDLDMCREAVERAREAVALTSPDAENYPLRCIDLSTAAVRLGLDTDDTELLSEAVEAAGRAVATIPVDDVRRVGILFNYASAVTCLAKRSSAPEPFDEAERAMHAALMLLPPGHPDHPRIRSSIAEVLYHRYRACGDIDALATSVTLAQQALNETPQDHHWWPIRAIMLARSARALSALGGPNASALREVALSRYQEIGTHPAATADQRMSAERTRTEILREGNPTTVLDAHERVIAVIPATVSRALPAANRLDTVRQLEGLADDVLAVGVQAGDVNRALGLVERCRCLLFGDAWGIRRGWARLREVSPHLAESLSKIERELDDADAYTGLKFTITVSVGSKSTETKWDPRPQATARVRRLAAARDHLLAEIRALPGFDDLLALPEPGVLRTRLAGHTVVLVSAHTAGGTALVVPADPNHELITMPLPDLRQSAAQTRITRLRTALTDAKDTATSFDRREEAQRDLHDVLEWLWDTAAAPVLDRVAPYQPGQTDLPRLWWCPIGVVGQLPLHAAGKHRPTSRAACTVFDRVVSSYTPSVTALADTLNASPPRRSRGTALVVGVGTVRGETVLSHAYTEADRVARLIPGSTVLLDEAADATAIQRGLHDHVVAHFACHAAAGRTELPTLTGGLALTDSMFVPAFVYDIRPAHAELAFLSACDTALTDPSYLDEPLNLASAFHLAGFRGVIGTLWHTRDSPEIAEAIYRTLTAAGTKSIDTTAAATALNTALRHSRDAYPALPTRWASHIHVGL